MPSRPICLLLSLLVFAESGWAQQTAPNPDDFQQLEAESRTIKSEVLDLEAELSVLEEDVRYPANTRWTVFVTAEAGAESTLNQIELQIGERTVASHEYTAEEQAALRNGGAHQLYIGNLDIGQHPISVHFSGANSKQPVNGDTKFVVSQPGGPRLLELHWQPGAGQALALAHSSLADTP